MIEEMLEVERDDLLGYSRHERKKDTANLRNGYSPKTVRSSQGDIKLYISIEQNNTMFLASLCQKVRYTFLNIL